MESLQGVTLRPWPAQKKEELSPEDIHIQIEQLTAERGHLRDITEASLQNDVVAGKDVPEGLSKYKETKLTVKEGLTRQELIERNVKANNEILSHIEYDQAALRDKATPN